MIDADAGDTRLEAAAGAERPADARSRIRKAVDLVSAIDRLLQVDLDPAERKQVEEARDCLVAKIDAVRDPGPDRAK